MALWKDPSVKESGPADAPGVAEPAPRAAERPGPVGVPSSPEAANAFLKLLEEPAADTLVFLTSSRPGALLPTIRSRVLEVRVTPPTPDEAQALRGVQAGASTRKLNGYSTPIIPTLLFAPAKP